MGFVDVIAKKRDGRALDRGDIDRFVAGVTTGDIPDYQAAALLMAIVLRGMTSEETYMLTDAMVRSGDRVDLSDLSGPKVGKHSTGGVGDKTTIIVAPIVAACGVIVPKISGRGLGHTGGTLDKLEAIPGYRIALSVPEFKRVLSSVGCSIISASASLAPADKRLYALRDVTATVESVPLIAASVMSKKLAESADALVLDVKCGWGALMKSEADARLLAETLVAIGTRAGLRTEAVITRMDSPLGRATGNALEVAECIETLKGQGPDDLASVAVALASRMLALAGHAEADAERTVRRAMASGAALEKLRDMIAAHGGDPAVVDDCRGLPSAARRTAVPAPRDGYVAALRADLIGRAAMALGAGRQRVEDAIDPAAGVVVIRKPGECVRMGEPVLELRHNRVGAHLDDAVALCSEAVALSTAAPELPPLVIGLVS